MPVEIGALRLNPRARRTWKAGEKGWGVMNTHSPGVIRLRAAAVVACVVLASGYSRAQGQADPLPTVNVGSRIRLLAPSVLDGRLQGLVTAMDDEALLVSEDGRPPINVPREAITRLEVSTGRSRQIVKGMAIGAGIGAAVIGPIYHADAKQSQCDNALVPCTTSVAAAEAFWTVAGAAVGAAIGAKFTVDRWRELPLGAVRISLAHSRVRGFTCGLRVVF